MQKSINSKIIRSEAGTDSEKVFVRIPVTRVFIKPDGDLVVTDLWDVIQPLLGRADSKPELGR